jgi:hypothetical protein
MKNPVPMPVAIAVVAVAVLAGGYFLWTRTVPHRPANAHTAAEGIRASIEKYRAAHPEAAQPGQNPQAARLRLRLGSKDRKDD